MHSFIFLFAVFLSATVGAAVELDEIGPPSYSLHRRDFAHFDLRSSETFLYGQHVENDAVLANFTVEMPDDTENILSIERFKGMLKDVACTNTSMTISFVDDGSYRYAQRAWDWVNGADNHSFVMVLGKGDCGNPHRVPYTVHTIEYEDTTLTASLAVQREEWSKVAHTYHLQAGSIPANHLRRRDISKSTSISLNADFRSKNKVEIGQSKVEIECNPCTIAGSIGFEFTVVTDHLIPKDVRFKAAPSGVQAVAEIKANFNVREGSHEIQTIPLGSFPLPGGITIPGNILNIGPVIKAEFVTEVGGQVAFAFGTGATASIPDTALLEVNMLNPSNNKVSSWLPKVDIHPAQFDKQEIKAAVKLTQAIQFSLSLGAEVLNKGIEASLALRMPYIETEAQLVGAVGGTVCDNAAANQDGGIKIETTWGVELKFIAGTWGDNDVVVTLAAGAWPLGDGICFPFDIPGSPKSKPSSPAGAKTPAKSIDPPASGSTPKPTTGANSCKVGNGDGRTGTCINKNTCGGNKKVPVPGWCPNDPDEVQCCVDPKPSSSASSCTVGGGDGRSGTCIHKTTCAGSNKVSVPGWCPNDPAEVQCCVEPTPSPTAKSCKVGDGSNRSGTCINKSTCTGSKVAVPGWCPDDPPEILCCVESPKAAPIGKSCKIGGSDKRSGTCMNKNTCTADSSKVPIPGYCPDDPPDVQCCVESKGSNTCINDKLGKTGSCLSTTVCEDSDGVSTPGYCPNDPPGIQVSYKKILDEYIS